MTDPISETPEDGVPVLATPEPVGEQLRAAREAAALTVADLAARLRLGARQVEALENGEWDRLPGATFVRGFVASYARQIGLDPAPLLAQLDVHVDRTSILDLPPEAPAAMHFGGGHGWRGMLGGRNRSVLLAGLGALLLAGLLYFILPDDLDAWRNDLQQFVDSLSRDEAPAPAVAAPEPVFPPGATPQQVLTPQALVPADAAPAPVVPPLGAPAPAAEPAVAGQAEAGALIAVVEKMSWLEVRDKENRVVFSQRLPSGSQHTIPGDAPLNVTVGYAPGVRLTWRGKEVDLPSVTRGDVARLILE